MEGREWEGRCSACAAASPWNCSGGLDVDILSCPACGRSYEMDSPKCPFCGEKNDKLF